MLLLLMVMMMMMLIVIRVREADCWPVTFIHEVKKVSVIIDRIIN